MASFVLSKGGLPALPTGPSLSSECPAGVEPACPVWKTDAWAARPRALRSAEGEGVEPSRLIARPVSTRLPSPVGLPLRIESGRLDSNQRSRASEARDHSRLVHVPKKQPCKSQKRQFLCVSYSRCRRGPISAISLTVHWVDAEPATRFKEFFREIRAATNQGIAAMQREPPSITGGGTRLVNPPTGTASSAQADFRQSFEYVP
jgi:hypothetical protein